MENFDLHQEYTGELINIIVKVPENGIERVDGGIG